MTEENLQHLSLDELYALLVKTINEYLILHKGLDADRVRAKRDELNVIHKVIDKRKAIR